MKNTIYCIFAVLSLVAISSAITCVQFKASTSMASGAVIVSIYSDYNCISNMYTGGFTYAGKGWDVVLGNCTSNVSFNLTDYQTYYYSYTINGIITPDGVCKSFVAKPPLNGSTILNTYISGANITNINQTLNITNNITNNITSGTGNCTGASVVQNVTTGGVQCITPAGSGTVTSITAGYGLNSTTITSTGTINVNDSVVQNRVSGNCSYGINLISQTGTITCASAPPVYNNGSSNLTLAQIEASIGNWSGNMSSYATTANLATVGNWSGNYSSYTATSGIATLMGNSTIARTGTASCAGAGVAQNVTTTTTGTTSQCIIPPQGTVTSIAASTGLLGGTITTSGTLEVNSTIVAFQNQSNTFTVNQTFSKNMTIGTTFGMILLGNGGSLNWNTTCTWVCFNASICSYTGTGC